MKKLLYLLPLVFAGALAACNGDEKISLPDITVGFASAQIGIGSNDASEDVIVALSRHSDAPVTVEITLAGDGAEYGDHYTTSPAATDGKITVIVPAGQPSAKFTVTKTAGALFDGSESVGLTIASLSVTDGVAIGEKNEATLTFGDIVSQGGTMVLEGAGVDGDADKAYHNSVYVDLSGNKQTVVVRTSWNLAFWCGEEFRVALNEAYGTAATPSAKNDITSVSKADADAIEAQYDLNANTMGGSFSETIFDAPNGSLEGLAFAEVKASDADNKVYFVAAAPQKTADRGDWYKVLVTRNGAGYRVKYGKVSGGAIATVDVPKAEGYNFAFLSLETGELVNAEPKAVRWDIKWSYDFGLSTTMPMLMFMQDFVSVNNHGGTRVAQVMTADKAYADFTLADAKALTLSSDRDPIGDRWRSTGGMGGTAGVKTDRFYVVKDPAGNYYKLRFTEMMSGGMRGRPEIKYDLLK